MVLSPSIESLLIKASNLTKSFFKNSARKNNCLHGNYLGTTRYHEMLARVNVRYLTNRGFSHDKITSEIYKYAKNNGKHADTTLD